VLANITEPALVLLGAPGAGKNTLLRHLQLAGAQAVLAAEGDLSQAPLTFFIQLNDYQPARPGEPLPPPLDWLAVRWAARASDLPPLQTVLRQQRLTLLLDAFNEIPVAGSEPTHLWRAFVRQLVHDYPGNRVVFSCRSLDYSATLSSRDLPVPQVRIEPLSDAQVQEFLLRYCPEHGAILWQKLQGTPQLALFRSPYYLTLLIEQSTTGDIPVGRAALFTGFVRRALQRELQAEHPLLQADALLHVDDVTRLTQGLWSTPYELPESGPLLPRLSTLAWQMQDRGLVDEAGQVRIAYNEAVKLLAHPRAEDLLRAGVALLVLERDLGQGQVLYRHQLLQEYFAARHLAQAPQPKLVQQEWRARRVVPSLQSTLQEIADADPLPPLPGTGWEETMLLAAAMTADADGFVTALMAHNLTLAGRCVAQPDVTISSVLREQLLQALVQRTQDRAADLRARIAAGLALGELGDPRFKLQHGPHGAYLLPPMMEIPGGTYRIGSNEGLYANEAPAHEVALRSFAMAQFPVTNAEWKLFMQAGGYENERWWDTPEAQAWRRGEGTAEGPKQQWRDYRQYMSIPDNFERERPSLTSQQIGLWEALVRMSDADFEALLSEQYREGRQTQPLFWTDDAFNHAAQPVVRICWYEARAYCAWLSAQTGQPFRLPTEAEWEAATRGLPRWRVVFWKGRQSRRYAFGDKFDATCCNTFETHIRRTTPIGVFPGGETPEGLSDMTGNVWEWTSSVYRDYPYDAADGREDHDATSARRVARGGAWFGINVLARASYRNHNHPDNRNNNLGLRVVRSSHIVIPLSTAQLMWCLRTWLLRACPSALPTRAVLPVLAADYGWRSAAKDVRMAQVRPARTGVLPQVGPMRCVTTSISLQALQQAKFRKIRAVVSSVSCEQLLSLHCGMGADKEVAYQMLPVPERRPTLLTGELLHPATLRADKPSAALAGIGSPGLPSTRKGCWLRWHQTHTGIGQKTFQLRSRGKVCSQFGIDHFIEYQRALLDGSIEGLLRGCRTWCIRNQDIQKDVGIDRGNHCPRMASRRVSGSCPLRWVR
jgi:formylglycine-generating enzyme required for sulfatase activity